MRARTQTFVEHYNKKHPEYTLDVAETHLEGKSNKALPSSTRTIRTSVRCKLSSSRPEWSLSCRI